MKKLLPLLGILLLLTGCAGNTALETVNDTIVTDNWVTAANLEISLPESASVPTLQGEDGAKFYDCGAYSLTTQILPSGDLNGTLQQLTGYTLENLSHMKTKQNTATRYDCVWAAAGESGDKVGRAVVLDDGNYHYAVTVMADAQNSGDLIAEWEAVLSSVKISTAPTRSDTTADTDPQQTGDTES